ncbi:MAG: hypothetical protein HC912_04675 [Saprospiraceae bacterium]|nr:hypothetical protein [Saprospiraceae bacterium]
MSLQFNLTYDGKPLAMFERFAYPNGASVFIDRFNLFISEVNLVNATGKQALKDVAWLDFTNLQDENTAKTGVKVEIPKVALGTYNALQIGLGVSPALNATTPSNYSASHPLANNYWEQWNSYISMVIEGKADLTGGTKHDLVLTYHVGTDEAYSTILIEDNFVIKTGSNTINLEIDLKKILTKAEQHLDIEQYPRDHSTRPEVFDFLRLNLPNAVQLSKN